MNRLARASFLIFFILLSSSSLTSAQAWSNGGYSSDPQNPDYGTHDWIADQALTIQTKDVSFLSSTYHLKYLLGTEAPDNPSNFSDSINHHIYYFSSSSIQDDASADRASVMYQTALNYLKANKKESAAYYIGAMTHYIGDVGVFGHTMGSGTDWGSENHHSDYESAVETMIHSLSLPSGSTLSDKTAYDAAISLAKDVTFGKGDIKTNVWMDSNYDWTYDVFEASAIASLYASAIYVAAAINHLMIEATPTSPPTTPPSTPPSQASPPQPPISFSATLENSHVKLTWLPPQSDGGAPIISYKIYRKTNQTLTSIIASVDNGIRNWIDESVEKGKTYYYSIRAVNSIGFSNATEEKSITIPSDDNSINSSLIVQILISSTLIAVGSGGVILWIRKKRK